MGKTKIFFTGDQTLDLKNNSKLRQILLYTWIVRQKKAWPFKISNIFVTIIYFLDTPVTIYTLSL